MKQDLNTYWLKHNQFIIDNTLDSIISADKDNNVLVFNKSAQKSFGYSFEEVQELNASELFANHAEFKKVISEIEKSGKYIGQVLNKKKSGELFTSFLTANQVYSDDGELLGTMGISRDISEELKKQEKFKKQYKKSQLLLKEAQKLSEIASSAINGIIETDSNGILTWCNESFEKITGYSKEELLGNRPSAFFKTPHFYKEKLKSIVSKGPNPDGTFEAVHYKKNGDLFWLLVEPTTIYNDDGSIKKIIEVSTEITEQKKAELARIETENRFNEIANTIQDVFYLYNISECEYEYISPNCKKVLGLEDSYFYSGQSSKLIVHPEDKYIHANAEARIRNGLDFDIEYRIFFNGQIKWIREQSSPVKDSFGDVIKNSGICSDITHRKLNEQIIEQQNKEINESINYASRIQNASLQNDTSLQKVFKDCIVFFQPKDTIGGDFYYSAQCNNHKGEAIKITAVGDCTGHGVPGAIMSLLCKNLMYQSFENPSVKSPSDSLEWVRKQLIEMFKNSNTMINDGMDVSLIKFNTVTYTLSYSGAHQSCFILRGNSIIELKGNRQHVGYTDSPIPFKDEKIQLEKGDQVLMFTDGISDQFGGPKNKKFLKKKFLEFALSNSHKSLESQKTNIINEFNKWKGDNEQTDDVCLLTFRP